MARHPLAEALDLAFAGNERLTNNSCLWWLRPAVTCCTRDVLILLLEKSVLCVTFRTCTPSQGLHLSVMHLERQRWNARNVTTPCYKSITCRLHEKGVWQTIPPFFVDLCWLFVSHATLQDSATNVSGVTAVATRWYGLNEDSFQCSASYKSDKTQKLVLIATDRKRNG